VTKVHQICQYLDKPLLVQAQLQSTLLLRMQTFVSHVKRHESIAARHCDLLKYIFGFIKKKKRINRKQIINKKEECLDGPKGHLLPN
jgi:hypothetical protein